MYLYVQMPVVHTMSDGSLLTGPNTRVLLFCFAWAAWNPLHPQSYTWFSWASGDFFQTDDYPAVNFNSHYLAHVDDLKHLGWRSQFTSPAASPPEIPVLHSVKF